MDVLDEVLKMFYYSICDVAKWLFAIKMASEIIKDTNTSDIQGIVKSLISGGVGYGSLYCIVGILDAVKVKFM